MSEKLATGMPVGDRKEASAERGLETLGSRPNEGSREGRGQGAIGIPVASFWTP